MVHCKDQEEIEIDYYWAKLSAVPESEVCGWLKDKYGVSWQIVPIVMDEMMRKGSKEQIARVTEAFLKHSLPAFQIQPLWTTRILEESLSSKFRPSVFDNINVPLF